MLSSLSLSPNSNFFNFLSAYIYTHTIRNWRKKKPQHINNRTTMGKRKKRKEKNVSHTHLVGILNQQTIKQTLNHGGKSSISKKIGRNLIFVFLSQWRKWQNWSMESQNCSVTITINLQCFLRRQRQDLRQGTQPAPSTQGR